MKLYTACFLFFCITLNIFSYEKAIFSEWTKENINIDDFDYFSEPITEIYTLNKDMFLILSDFKHAYLTDNKNYLKIIFANCCTIKNYGQTTSKQLQEFRLGDFYTYVLDFNYDEKLDLLNYSVSGMAVQLFIKTLDTDLYLLGHLSAYNRKKGEPVYPGDIVAYVGNTGASAGAHLHVEVFECDNKTLLENVINTNADENNELFWKVGFNHRGKRVNPFNHNEYRG